MHWFASRDGALDDAGTAGEAGAVTRSVSRLFSADGKLATGEWDSRAARHAFRFDFDEIIYFVEGEAIVTIGGDRRTFKAGDVLFIPAGTPMDWDVPKYVRKVWVHRYPPGVVGRVLGKAKGAARYWVRRVTDARGARRTDG